LPFASRKTTEFAPLDDVTPVPPLATASVPARVIAPFVAVLGVSPVVPPENVKTPVFAMVTGVEPLNEPPDNPEPIVRVLVVAAVIVPLPPKAMLVPLTVIEEFAKKLLVIGVAFQTPVVIVPTLVNDEPVTVEFKVVPVKVPAAAVTVPDAPRAIETPLTVRLEFANCAFVTVPLKAVVGIVVDAVRLPDPLAYAYPVRPVTASAVNFAVLAAVPPIAGGDAK